MRRLPAVETRLIASLHQNPHHLRDLWETFAHNGYGQDETWVRANFTNAEEILSVGYLQWVDAQVGYNLTNGLYKLTASFANAPLEAVNLTIGDLSVAVTNTAATAFTVCNWNSVVMADWATDFTLAHEFGHILGLDDIYARWKDNPSLPMAGYNDPAYADIFEDKVHDWSVEDGRGFYETEDKHGVLAEHLLMNGIDRSEEGIISVDIPSGSVRGYPEQPRHSFDKPFRKVGAVFITGEPGDPGIDENDDSEKFTLDTYEELFSKYPTDCVGATGGKQ